MVHKQLSKILNKIENDLAFSFLMVLPPEESANSPRFSIKNTQRLAQRDVAFLNWSVPVVLQKCVAMKNESGSPASLTSGKKSKHKLDVMLSHSKLMGP